MKILVFAGSTRKDSVNKQLARLAARECAGTFIDLSDYPLPLYDGDLELAEGVPENANKLRKLFLEHDGLIIASPEYNGSISGVLKNTIDWISRPNLTPFAAKKAAILSASPGMWGGIRGLPHLRDILQTIGVTVMPKMMMVTKCFEAFDGRGELTSESRQLSLKALVGQLK